MKKNNFIATVCLFVLAGCNPFGERQNSTEEFITKAEKTSKKMQAAYKPQIRTIKPPKTLEYKQPLSDPFRGRDFALQETQNDLQESVLSSQVCTPPKCVPPEPHEKTFLENYNLTSLQFVGALLNDKEVALIKTPDFGVVEVGLGDYLGNNNGKVVQIHKSHVVLQEKILKAGIWKNKKTTLVIKQ